MQHKITHFNVSEYLDSEAIIQEYLTQVLADGDNDELLQAIGHIAKARGISKIAKRTGLNRENLYKIFRAESKPKFDTVMRVLQALDIQLSIKSDSQDNRVSSKL